jgi:hypothetical protein
VFKRKEREAAFTMSMLGNLSDATSGKASGVPPDVLRERMPLALRALKSCGSV